MTPATRHDDSMLAQVAGLLTPDWAVRDLGPGLQQQVLDALRAMKHGELERWLNAVESLPTLTAPDLELNRPAPRIATVGGSEGSAEAVRGALEALRPWRKGPFEILGCSIDAEWRSDLKWERLSAALDVHGARVLDVGSGNGYYCLRLLGAGAERVIGIDPSLLYVMQFAALRKLAPELRACVLPFGLESLPAPIRAFDTVLSMGVLYHRRSPLDHLFELKQALRPGGKLALETLIVEGEAGYALTPEDRYAAMRNVWFVPSLGTLKIWLARTGFTDVQLIDVSITTSTEQRRTAWMPFQSLEDFLMPTDPTRTREGYPAPRRALVLAGRPG